MSYHIARKSDDAGIRAAQALGLYALGAEMKDLGRDKERTACREEALLICPASRAPFRDSNMRAKIWKYGTHQAIAT
ncbi:uncharacterized protein A1O5_08441 [Cladophialophora psammophila CBS 110553]|uniref:Uncharacterized protein n=1 Tax=Cladophialophora psammophila CBS 110553 TaxID=1182543 RepID=W9WKF8_9EURO|nr:uncharacterized protein A1O5_08441 [Cladophialophora psammophila CBS 110553]EXJ68647.1 hypothetical protein A1O5_08441 [Cladophialophora psammophila CBS 110553]